jgi:hypothetical protein
MGEMNLFLFDDIGLQSMKSRLRNSRTGSCEMSLNRRSAGASVWSGFMGHTNDVI